MGNALQTVAPLHPSLTATGCKMFLGNLKWVACNASSLEALASGGQSGAVQICPRDMSSCTPRDPCLALYCSSDMWATEAESVREVVMARCVCVSLDIVMCSVFREAKSFPLWSPDSVLKAKTKCTESDKHKCKRLFFGMRNAHIPTKLK